MNLADFYTHGGDAHSYLYESYIPYKNKVWRVAR